MRRWLGLFSFLQLDAWAQIQVLQFDGTNSNPVGALVDFGSAAPGDTLETRFHVRNVGSGPAIFQSLTLAGSGFRISSAPSLPYTIAPGSEVEFRVAFNPTSTGTYSAFLVVNTINITLRGTVAPTAVLTLASGTGLSAGALVDFGSLLRGASKLETFTLANPEALV